MIGARGQLGSALVDRRWAVGTLVLPVTRDQLDLTDPAAVWSYLLRWRPQVVVNAAAYTQVDRAEDEPELAVAVNQAAVASIVQGVRAIGARLIHVSTDYVFDGTADGWYREADQVNPLGVYGRSKRAGELEAFALDDSLVVRTSGLYSSTGTNFVRTIRQFGRERDRLEVVDDQRLCPTSAEDLAEAIGVAIEAGLKHTGLFHVAAPDDASWWEVADEILHLDDRRSAVELDRISTEQRMAQGRSIARRPADSRLSSEAFATAYDHTLRPWREALADVCRQLSRRDGEQATAPV
ncbi:MAG: dTDP-4-dehydrorhamnose reductase [Actinomycetota bacterium]